MLDVDAAIDAHGQSRANSLLGLRRAYRHGDNFLDDALFLEAHRLLHGDLAEGVHAVRRGSTQACTARTAGVVRERVLRDGAAVAPRLLSHLSSHAARALDRKRPHAACLVRAVRGGAQTSS